MPSVERRDKVTVERHFDGPPNPDYPPKGVMMEIEERYRIHIEDVSFPEPGRVRVEGWGLEETGQSRNTGMGGV
jgi:hypothetical protein